MAKIREPIVEGLFYPAAADKLNKQISSFLEEVQPLKKNAIAIIAPHAALKYAGQIAAMAYKSVLPFSPERVVVLGPVHNSIEAEIILSESNQFRISNKYLKVDTKLTKKLLSFQPKIIANDIPHLEEHTIEVQLVFIQYLFPKALLIPILFSQPSLKTIKSLANLFQQIFEPSFSKTLFVVSANLTSFLVKAEAEKQAQLVLEAIQKNDVEYLLFKYEEGKISSCGIPGIALLMYLFKDKTKINILGLGNSAEAEEDKTGCIYYAAIGFFCKEGK